VIYDGRSKFGKPLSDFVAERGAAPSRLDRDAAPAEACVNALGQDVRWVALCPDCAGAEYVWWDDPRFYCVACQNASIGGRWRPVLLPDDRQAIEAALMARPDPSTRHCLPGETVDDLLAENAAYGVTP